MTVSFFIVALNVLLLLQKLEQSKFAARAHTTELLLSFQYTT